jgi:alanyl-tRNA synthetase
LKLLAQKLIRQAPNVDALLGSITPQPSLVFAQSAGQPFDMGALMKQIMAKFAGRGGGSNDMAQGGLSDAATIAPALADAANSLDAPKP